MAVPVVETGWSTDVSGDVRSTLTIGMPSNLATNDLCIILVWTDDTTNTVQFDNSTNKPTGFTFIGEAGDQTSDCHIAAFWKKIDGLESWPITCTAVSADEFVATAVRVTGADTTTPVNIVGADITSSGTSLAITGATTDANDCLVFYINAHDGDDGPPFAVTGTGWAEKAEIGSGEGNGNGVSGSWGTRDLASLGASGTATVSNAASDGIGGFQFAINASVAANPIITNAEDEDFFDGEQSVVITGTDFGGVEGAVYISDTETKGGAGTFVLLETTAWADTEITVHMQEDATGNPISDDIELFKSKFLIVEHDDTTESSGFGCIISTQPLYALNTDGDITVDIVNILLVRIEIPDDIGATAYRWAFNHAGGGDTALTTSSSEVKALATAAFVDDDDVAEFLTGSGSFIANNNSATEDGTFTLPGTPAAGESFVAALSYKLDSANVSNAETGTIRLELNDDTDLTYTNTFTYTVVGVGSGVSIPVALHSYRQLHQG